MTSVLTHRAGPVATITLSRPEALNAITREMLDELATALDDVSSDHGTRVIVLTGAGRAFSAGVDLKELQGRSLEGGAVGDFLDVPARAVIRRLCTVPQAVIARINGFCFTGALELALACDLVVTAEEAVLGDTHAKWGLRPTWGMIRRLPRAVGFNRARELSFTGRTFTGSEAAQWGLAVRAVPLSQLDDAVGALGEEIAANSAGSVAAYKDLYRHWLEDDSKDDLDHEAATVYRIDDTEERIASFR
jgi:enoyl-CoA hydratase/carnithine racemase